MTSIEVGQEQALGHRDHEQSGRASRNFARLGGSASLEDIGGAAPFEVLTGRFDVSDNNPSDVIASEWQWMLKDAERAD